MGSGGGAGTAESGGQRHRPHACAALERPIPLHRREPPCLGNHADPCVADEPKGARSGVDRREVARSDRRPRRLPRPVVGVAQRDCFRIRRVLDRQRAGGGCRQEQRQRSDGSAGHREEGKWGRRTHAGGALTARAPKGAPQPRGGGRHWLELQRSGTPWHATPPLALAFCDGSAWPPGPRCSCTSRCLGLTRCRGDRARTVRASGCGWSRRGTGPPSSWTRRPKKACFARSGAVPLLWSPFSGRRGRVRAS